MKRRTHWLENAERVTSGDLRLIAEDDNGELLAPSRSRADWWDERLNLRRPRHLWFWLRSRILRRVVMVEAER